MKQSLEESMKLYSKYQDIIHNDKPNDENEFIEFLVESSLKVGGIGKNHTNELTY